MNRYSFMKGWMRVPQGDKEAVKHQILSIYQHWSRPFWTAILYGRKKINIDQMEATEAVFQNLKPPIKKIWGEA